MAPPPAPLGADLKFLTPENPKRPLACACFSWLL